MLYIFVPCTNKFGIYRTVVNCYRKNKKTAVLFKYLRQPNLNDTFWSVYNLDTVCQLLMHNACDGRDDIKLAPQHE